MWKQFISFDSQAYKLYFNETILTRAISETCCGLLSSKFYFITLPCIPSSLHSYWLVVVFIRDKISQNNLYEMPERRQGWSSPAPRHHVHLYVLLLLAAASSSHLGHQARVPHPHGAPIAQVVGVELLVQRHVAGHDGGAAPGPGEPSPAHLGVLALAGFYQRRSLVAPGTQGGAGPRYGGQRPQSSSSHCQPESWWLRLLKLNIFSFLNFNL